MLKITFLGAVREVGRSCFLLEFGKKKILLDAGIKLSENKEERFPIFPLKLAKKVNAIIVSHAHIDHSGFIPFLVQKGFHGKIFTTKPTRDIIQLLLSDAMRIAKENKEKTYSEKEIKKTFQLIESIEFEKEFEVLSKVKAKFFNAGHILGSAMVLLKLGNKKLLYTGDFSLRESNLLEKAKVPREKIDFLITESTYSGKKDNLPSLKNSSKELADAIKETFKRDGKVLVPCFAVGRGQEVMFVLENYIRSGYLKNATIFVDGMLQKANKICRHNVIFLREEIPKRILLADDDPFKSPFIKVPKTKSRNDVLKHKNTVVLSTSGMLSGGPVLNYFKKIAHDENSSLVLVGYQAEGSLGRKLLEGAKEVEIQGKKIKVKLQVKKISFSGHADYNALLEFAQKIKAKKTFLVHGEKEKCLEFQRILQKKKLKVFVPKLGEKFILSKKEKIHGKSS